MPTTITLDITPCVNANFEQPMPNGKKIKIYIGTYFTGYYGTWNSTTLQWVVNTMTAHGTSNVDIEPCLPSNPAHDTQYIINGIECFNSSVDNKWYCGHPA